MKRYLWLMLILVLLIPQLLTAAPQPAFLVLDNGSSRVEVIGSNFKTINSYKVGSKPVNVIKSPSYDGNILLYQGVAKTKTPGALVYLDQNLKPTARQITLPGPVIEDFYLKDFDIWIVVTISGEKEQYTSTINIYNLGNGNINQVPLNSIPSVYQFHPETRRLAVATIGSSKNGVSPELYLLNLSDYSFKQFPVSTNPGAIFFGSETKIMVACGGYRKTQKYPEDVMMERTDKPAPAALCWIDTADGSVKTLSVNFSPLVISQDRWNQDLFYVATSNLKEEPIGDGYIHIFNKQPEPNHTTDSAGILRKVVDGEVIAEISISAEPIQLRQTKPGKLCLLGREDFFLIENKDSGFAIIKEYHYDFKIEELKLNLEETVGYLANVNSNYLEIFDLITGDRIKKLSIGSPSMLGALRISNLFVAPIPPVAGFTSLPDAINNHLSPNHRMFFSADHSYLYAMSSLADVSVIDLKSNNIRNNISYTGYVHGIHPTPDQRLIVATTDTFWYLLDPGQNKPILRVPVSEDETGPKSGFYSPDGHLLVIPHNYSLYCIDTKSGKYVGKISSKAHKPLLFWP